MDNPMQLKGKKTDLFQEGLTFIVKGDNPEHEVHPFSFEVAKSKSNPVNTKKPRLSIREHHNEWLVFGQESGGRRISIVFDTEEDAREYKQRVYGGESALLVSADILLRKYPKKSENNSLSLEWDNLHLQSREEIASGAGMRNIAANKWDDIEPWMQQALADSISKRSKGKSTLAKVSEVKPSGYVQDGGYVDRYAVLIDKSSVKDATIKPGDKIKLNFAGGPNDLPKPWILVRAEDKFSTVSYKNKPSVTIRASDGTERTFDDAEIYSPHKVNSDIIATPIAAEPKAEHEEPVNLPNISRVELEAIEKARSPRSRQSDEARLSKKIVVTLRSKRGQRRAKAWAKHPGQYDIKGIDTPKTAILK
jgi:hypothetical protein